MDCETYFHIFAGHEGDLAGRLVGECTELPDAKRMASKWRKKYGGGWSRIVDMGHGTVYMTGNREI